MSKVVFLVALVILLSLALVILAQENDSAPSLCTDGTWYCPDPNDPDREAWNWACGAYWAQYYADMIEEVPEWCMGPTPAAPTAPPPPTITPTITPTDEPT